MVYRFFYRAACMLLIFSSSIQADQLSLYSYQTWWEIYAGSPGYWPNLDRWANDFNTPSRRAFRTYLSTTDYSSLLDIPCGVGTDYFGLRADNFTLNYTGIELTKKLLDFCKLKNIPCMQGSIEAIPSPSNSFDIAYARHILEHLPYYESALNELIRVAIKEVLVVFFIPPKDNRPDNINLLYLRGLPIYNNYYNKEKIELFLKSNVKVDHIAWRSASPQEKFLHIYLKR